MNTLATEFSSQTQAERVLDLDLGITTVDATSTLNPYCAVARNPYCSLKPNALGATIVLAI